MPYEEWLEYRRLGIRGSDASVVCGINRYKSPVELWMDKTGQLPAQESGESAYWGTQLEPIVRAEFSKRTGIFVAEVHELLQSGEHPFMLANLDGVCEHPDLGTCVFEAKTASAYKAGEWEDTIPDEYMCQIQHYMAVTGYKGAYIAVLIGGNTFNWKFVERDEELISMLIELETDFWNHVQDVTPPPLDGSKASAKFLSERFPSSKPLSHIALPDTAAALLEQYDEACEELEAVTERKQQAENLLKEMMGDNEIGTTGDRVITWKSVSQERLDSKTLKAEHPALYKKYANQTSYRRFTIKAVEYRMFREIVEKEPKRLMSKPLSATLNVMDHLYAGNTCLFTKTNGFCVYRHYPPQLHFGACQTLMFDATAEVDNDYSYLPSVQMLSGTPKASPRRVVFHLHTHRDLNVSKRAMEKSWKLPAFTEYIASLIEDTDRPVFLCTYKKYAVELAARLMDRLAPEAMSKVLLMPDRDEPTIPYFNGTNGSNAFKDAETVIILGYPRLDPSTYLSFTCAACGQEVLAAELDAIPEEKLLSKDFSVLELPSVRDYVAHHLAARLEQEIYRCAQRNPGFTGEINIHLFCPPADVRSILLKRIHGEVDEDPELPGCVERCKGIARRYKGGTTSFGRLSQFLETWDGAPLHVSEIQKLLDISSSVWKNLMQEERVEALLDEYAVKRTGRGPHAKWQILHERCA